MGASQSTSQAPPRALHVLRVTPASPAAAAALEPFFDFIVGFRDAAPAGPDHLPASTPIDAAKLEHIVESREGKTLDLLVWNSKSQATRVVPITPSREWAQRASSSAAHDANAKPSLLGLSMRMCEPELALDNVWHVLDVLEGSPAEDAGLVPYGDWVIGWAGGVLAAEGDFYDVVEAHIGKPLRVYVYSYDFDTIREVVLVPNREWGGEGLLGCVFGFGLLHRIPPLPQREPGALPAELLPENFDPSYPFDGEWPEDELTSPPEDYAQYTPNFDGVYEEDEGAADEGEEDEDEYDEDDGLFVPADAIQGGYAAAPQTQPRTHAPNPVRTQGPGPAHAHTHTPERAATPRAHAHPNINGHGYGIGFGMPLGVGVRAPGTPPAGPVRRPSVGYAWSREGKAGHVAEDGEYEDREDGEREDGGAAPSVADTDVTATSLTSVD